MLHLLKQSLVFAPQTIVLPFDAFQLDRGVSQLRLSLPTGLDRDLQVLDVVRG